MHFPCRYARGPEGVLSFSAEQISLELMCNSCGLGDGHVEVALVTRSKPCLGMSSEPGPCLSASLLSVPASQAFPAVGFGETTALTSMLVHKAPSFLLIPLAHQIGWIVSDGAVMLP